MAHDVKFVQMRCQWFTAVVLWPWTTRACRDIWVELSVDSLMYLEDSVKPGRDVCERTLYDMVVVRFTCVRPPTVYRRITPAGAGAH